MNEQIIKAIDEAEERAATMRRTAADQVVAVGQRAEEECARLQARSNAARTAEREQRLASAKQRADEEYAASLSEARQRAQALADACRQTQQDEVKEIVRRIQSGC